MPDQAVDITSGTIAANVRPYERFTESLLRQATADSTSRAFDVAANQVDKIISATTADEIMNADEGGVVSGQDMEDVDLRIRDYTVGKSADEFNATLGVFILMDCINLETGEEVIVNTGAALIIAKVVALKANGLLPFDAVIKGTKTRNGTLLRLRPVKQRATNSAGTSVE